MFLCPHITMDRGGRQIFHGLDIAEKRFYRGSCGCGICLGCAFQKSKCFVPVSRIPSLDSCWCSHTFFWGKQWVSSIPAVLRPKGWAQAEKRWCPASHSLGQALWFPSLPAGHSSAFLSQCLPQSVLFPEPLVTLSEQRQRAWAFSQGLLQKELVTAMMD